MKKYWVGLSSLEELGSNFILKLYEHFFDIEKAFNAGREELTQIEGLSLKKIEKFLNLRDKVKPELSLSRVEENNIHVITYEDEEYPKLLKEIANPPAVLYVKGNLKKCNLDKTVAVVGSRRASSNGKMSLEKIIKDLANTDICIVSGLAAGIDSTAHYCALQNNLKTIGVIASGFDYTYPESNRELYKMISNDGGAILSEYYPTFEPLKFRFPERNRIVTGISYGTLVVEAALKSGALISANLTLEQGRELMCVPGLITNPNTEGIYKLLKNGATLVTEGDDILNALGWEIKQPEQQKLNLDNIVSNLEKEESMILSAIEIEPKSFDCIQNETKLSTDDLLTNLTTLELKGIIKQVEGDRYTKV